MTTPTIQADSSEKQIGNLLLVVGKDRFEEFTDTLAEADMATLTAVFDNQAEDSVIPSALAKETIATALWKFLHRKGQEIIGAR